jgi:predicted ATPase
MADNRNKLNRLYDAQNRFANFGPVLTKLRIEGIRCHTRTLIDLNSPIAAFSGLNGTGKSTILQVACNAWSHVNGYRNYFKNFFVISKLDPAPFTANAKVEYAFFTAARTARPVTISRSGDSWTGYRRRPTGNAFLTGIGTYIPRIEQPSFKNKAGRLEVRSSDEAGDRIKHWTAKILGHSYDSVLHNTLNTTDRRGGRISSVKIAGVTYSEAHMGFGEARTIHILSALETLPERTLILLEEPETSLHPSAQHMFGQYLVDVCIERRHQIMLTTHSEFLLQALPAASRFYLHRGTNGVETMPGMTAVEAKSLMTQGAVKALTVLVEDPTGQEILQEIVRRRDPLFLRTLNICVSGDKDHLSQVVRTLQRSDLKVAAVRDGDMGDSVRENIFKLPGSLAPEKEMFGARKVLEFIDQRLGISKQQLDAAIQGSDHHEWITILADMAIRSSESLRHDLAEAYVQGLPETEVTTLVELLKAAVEK